MAEEKVSQGFTLKNIDKTTHYLTEEINQNNLMIKKFKKVCTSINYVEL